MPKQAEITRRDFMGNTLLGSGAVLLGMASPLAVRQATAQTPGLPMTGLGPEWSGPGGVGDYANANANTWEMVNAGHGGVRNQDEDQYLGSATDTGETFDVIVVGGGVSGLAAMYRYHKERPNSPILNLDNAPIFGGESRRNEFMVDGVRLYGPQGPQVFTSNRPPKEMWAMNAELGFPEEFQWTEPTGLTTKDLRVATSSWTSTDELGADIGYFYGSKGWVKNPERDGFKHAPIPEEWKRDLIRVSAAEEPPYRPPGDLNRWLDSLSYQDLLTQYFKVNPQIIPYLDGLLATGENGLGADAASAYLTVCGEYPGAHTYSKESNAWQLLGFKQRIGAYTNIKWVVPPGGNAVVPRTLVQRMIPGVFSGTSWTDIWLNPINWKALDVPNQTVRIRPGATVVAISHEGPPDRARGVIAWYVKGGKLYKVRAKAMIVATPQHVNKHICKDVPTEYREAMNDFNHAPVLIVNVGVRNWKFLDRLGISSARWFGDFGWHTSIHKNVRVDGKDIMPSDPAKPAVMETHVTFQVRGLPPPQQATAARMRLFAMAYADIEKAIRRQFNEMFNSTGFDADRDIGAIIANRQGHAMPVMPPGFYFGRNGKPAAKDVLQNPHHRMVFCHTELTGLQTWANASIIGPRAAQQILEII